MNRMSSHGKASVSVVLVVSLLIGLLGFTRLISTSEAASLSKVQSILTNSAPNASSSMTLYFVTPTGVSGAADKTITIELDTTGTAFVLPAGYDYTSVDIATSSNATCSGPFTDITLAAATSTTAWTAGFNTGTDILTMTYPGGGTTNTQIPAGTCVQVQIGSIATAGSAGVDFSTPVKVATAGTADIYTMAVGGTFGDLGNAMAAIIEGVTVSATVTESMSFSMTGVTAGSCTGDSGTPTVVDTSASSSTIPFGTVTGNAFKVGCHRLSMSTNASNGFSATIQENQNLKNGSNVIIPDTTGDSTSATESVTSTWATATNNGFGYSCENISGNGLCSTIGVASYRQIACTGADAVCDPDTGGETPQIFMSTSSPVSAQDVRLHYKISVSGAQAAGTYSNTVTYVVAPQF